MTKLQRIQTNCMILFMIIGSYKIGIFLNIKIAIFIKIAIVTPIELYLTYVLLVAKATGL